MFYNRSFLNLFLICFFTFFNIHFKAWHYFFRIYLGGWVSCTCHEKLLWHAEEPNVVKQLVCRVFTSRYLLYICCFLDLVQVPWYSLQVAIMVFCLFVKPSLYLKQLLETFSLYLIFKYPCKISQNGKY